MAALAMLLKDGADVLVEADLGRSGARWFIPACAGVAVNLGDARQMLDPSASPPPGSVVVGFEVQEIGDSFAPRTMTITSTGIFEGPFASPRPCEGSPAASNRVP